VFGLEIVHVGEQADAYGADIEKASVDNEQRKSGSMGVVGDQVERTKTPC
jgi:hypothetical protein